jgi:hypothetical protein
MKMSDFVRKCNDMIVKYGDLEIGHVEFAEDSLEGYLEFDISDVNIELVPDPRDDYNAIFVID